MARSLISQRRLLLLAIAAMLVVSLTPARWSLWFARPARAVAVFVSTPFVHASSWVARGFQGPAREPPPDLAAREALEEQYQQLLQYNRRLQIELEQTQDELVELSGIRDVVTKRNLQLLPARVVAFDQSHGQQTMLLGRGARHGVRRGQAVSSGMNLVGRVVEAGPVTATVRTIKQPDQTLLVQFASTAPRQTLPESLVSLQLSEKGDRFVAVTGQDEPVEQGDLAHLSDETWPRSAWGAVVGVIREIEPLPTDPYLRQQVFVEPLVRYERLGRVVVWIAAED